MHQSKLFELVPYPGSSHPDLQVSARFHLDSGLLTIRYEVKGPDVPGLLLPQKEPKAPPERKDGLWEHTCFEAFLARPLDSGYWEINVASSRDWNCYRLSNYREGLELERRITSIQVNPIQSVSKSQFSLAAEVNLSTIFPADDRLKFQLGLTAVIETLDGAKSYWAITHCGPKPDFHLRESFQKI